MSLYSHLRLWVFMINIRSLRVKIIWKKNILYDITVITGTLLSVTIIQNGFVHWKFFSYIRDRITFIIYFPFIKYYKTFLISYIRLYRVNVIFYGYGVFKGFVRDSVPWQWKLIVTQIFFSRSLTLIIKTNEKVSHIKEEIYLRMTKI